MFRLILTKNFVYPKLLEKLQEVKKKKKIEFNNYQTTPYIIVKCEKTKGKDKFFLDKSQSTLPNIHLRNISKLNFQN